VGLYFPYSGGKDPRSWIKGWQLAGTDVNERWQAEMAPYCAEMNGGHPIRGFGRVAEIFHLG
jgi:hypothetical protein